MPKPVQYTQRTRETKYIHADWWSPKRTTDGNLHSPEVDENEPGIPVEHVTIYADQYGADTLSVTTRMLRNVDLQRVSEPKSANELAKQRYYLFQRMVLEITDDQGQAQILNEDFMMRTPERDLDFIEREIKKLSQSPVEVTPSDQERFERQGAHYDELAESGYPEHLRELKSADQIAQDNFRRNN